jgi:multidrug efflux system outer membrane protein
VANVHLSEAERDAAVATYRKAIQTAFREVSDALARQGTAGIELREREAQLASAEDNYRLSEARYRAGIDNFLLTLDSQRNLFSGPAERGANAARYLPRTSSISTAPLAGTRSTLRPDLVAAIAVPPHSLLAER